MEALLLASSHGNGGVQAHGCRPEGSWTRGDFLESSIRCTKGWIWDGGAAFTRLGVPLAV